MCAGEYRGHSGPDPPQCHASHHGDTEGHGKGAVLPDEVEPQARNGWIRAHARTAPVAGRLLQTKYGKYSRYGKYGIYGNQQHIQRDCNLI